MRPNMGALLDNLIESWKRQPDEQNTILLCEQLGISGQAKLVDEVGKNASMKYASNPSVLLAVARMYLDAGFEVVDATPRLQWGREIELRHYELKV